MRYDFITLDNADSGNDDSSYTEKTGKVNGSSVRVRKGAGTSNDIVTVFNTGAAVTITGESKDSAGATWYKVTFTGGEGYIHSDYVTLTDASSSDSTPAPSNPSYEQKTGKVNQDFVNVRAGAGTNHAARTSLRVNTAVTITGEEKDSAGTVWYKITHAGGSGYMRHDFITIGSGDSSNAGSDNSGNTGSNAGSNVNVPTEGVAGKEGIENQPMVNVRKSADANAEVVVVIEQDVSVFIETATKDSAGIVWYKVSFAGETGYMMGQFITVK